MIDPELKQFVWIGLSTMDALISTILALYFIKLHQRFGKYMAVVFVGLAVEAVGTRLVFFMTSSGIAPGDWAFLARFSFKLVKVTPMAVLLLYLLDIKQVLHLKTKKEDDK